MHNLAIITARGGSKRIPRKNIKESGVFDEVMVSTDDSEIARIAIASGAAVPFMRSEATSNDYASTDDVIAEVLDMYKAAGKTFDSFCCIYPTAPFITPDRLAGAMTLLGEHESVMPVVAYSYPPQRSVVIRDGLIVRRFPECLNSRSQDLEKFYHDCGQFYACRADAFRRGGTTDVDDLAPLVLDDAEVQDIDTLEDWAIAEEKFKRLHC